MRKKLFSLALLCCTMIFGLDATAQLSGSTTVTNVSCNGGTDGSATVSISGGTSTYTYAWSTGSTTLATTSTTNTITGLTAGTYTVAVVDAVPDTIVLSAIVTEPTVLLSSAVGTMPSCNGFSDGTATASATGGTSPYTYSWNNGGTSPTQTGLASGTYIVTITDQNGCTDSASVVVNDPAALVSSASLVSSVSCNGLSDGEALASATGGNSSYTYSWSNGATTAGVTSVAAGTFSVTITDGNGCTDSSSVTITEPATLVASSLVDSTVSCNGGMDGGLTSSAVGGTTPFTYSWSNGDNTASITGLNAGTYSVTVTDANGCTDSTSSTVIEPAALVSVAVVDSNATCGGVANGGATSGATGGTAPYSYTWSNAATTASITGVAAGTYSVTITDANGCTDSSSVIITEPAAVVATATLDSIPECFGELEGGSTASATGGTPTYTYAWSNAATTASITGVAAGTYSVTITDANGCTDSTSVVVTQPGELIANANLINNVGCNGEFDGKVNALTTGGTASFTYAWSTGATTDSLIGLGAGTYTVTITDANGCTDSNFVEVTEPAVLSVSASLDSNASCFGVADGGATVSVMGGTAAYNYTWENGATTASITGVTAGTYNVTVVDAGGCTDTSVVSIGEPAEIVITASVDSNASCNGGSDGAATVMASGGAASFSYAWSNGDTTTAITDLAAGTFSVTVTDTTGCAVSESVSITEPAPATATITIDSTVSCYGGTNGGATVSIATGTMPYTYAWNNSATTASITGVSMGSYSATVTDADGCISTASTTITEATEITLTDSTVMAICNGDSNGAAFVEAAGGTGALTYAWDNGSLTDSITNTGAGTYVVTVTDANGCQVPFNVTINQPTAVAIAINEIKDTKCEFGSNGFVKTTASGGTAPYMYSWNNGDTLDDALALGVGMYYLTVTDTLGCTAVDSAYVDFINAAPAFTIQGKDTACYGEINNLLVLGVASWNWSTGSTTASTAADTTGTYKVTITNSIGCENYGSFDVFVNDQIIPNITGTDALCAEGTTGTAVANPTGGFGGYVFDWSNGATAASAGDLAIGTHSVVVSDALGCADSAEVTIDYINENPIIAFPTDTTVCEFTVIELNTGVTGGTYNWSTGATTATILANAAGTYSVELTDANGCDAEGSIVINYDACNGIEEQSSLDAVVYPNPSNGLFNVVLADFSGAAQLNVYDFTGKQVFNVAQNISAGEMIQVNTPAVSGVYFLEINLDGQTLHKKLTVK